jgi:hypothetical protein
MFSPFAYLVDLSRMTVFQKHHFDPRKYVTSRRTISNGSPPLAVYHVVGRKDHSRWRRPLWCHDLSAAGALRQGI